MKYLISNVESRNNTEYRMSNIQRLPINVLLSGQSLDIRNYKFEFSKQEVL